MDPREIERIIAAGIPGARVSVQGDDGRHYQAVVVSDAFAGMNMVRQHQLVYRALGELMQDAIHALSIRTLTPEQWDRERAGGG
ncbi:MAG: BolA family protein [Gammaproteobacteria bacterium]